MIPGDELRRTGPVVREDVVKALANLNCDASLVRVQRTRCSLREAALGLQEQRLRRRRNIGLALAAFFCLLVLLAPAVWNSAEDLMGGEHLNDFPLQIAFFLLMLFPAMLAALVAVWKERSSAAQYDGQSS
ncbi:MAG TPA: hypothetical protein VGR96_11650 [Acidobacteriaceae bacterium]|nr:hypothetical protein [Acidobacteriaceae bacterium]